MPHTFRPRFARPLLGALTLALTVSAAAAGPKAYVGEFEDNAVSVIDSATDRVARTIDVGKTSHGLGMMPDGRLLRVGVSGEDRNAVVDTANQAIVARESVAKAHPIAIHHDGKFAYVVVQEPGKFTRVVVERATRPARAFVSRMTIPSSTTTFAPCILI